MNLRKIEEHINPRKIVRFFKMLAQNEVDGSDRAMAMFIYVVIAFCDIFSILCLVTGIFRGW